MFNAGGVLAITSTGGFTTTDTTTFWYKAEFDPILHDTCTSSCPNGSMIQVRSVVLDALGTPVQTLVQEKGIPEFGVQMYGKQKVDLQGNLLYLDAQDNETTTITAVPAIEQVKYGTAGGQALWFDATGHLVFDSR